MPELHLIAQPSSKVDSSVDLLHRIARNRDVSLAADMGRALQGARGWAEWGGRGWLGKTRCPPPCGNAESLSDLFLRPFPPQVLHGAGASNVERKEFERSLVPFPRRLPRKISNQS